MPLDSTRQDFNIRLLANQPLGAEVLGLDLAQPLSIDDFDRLHRAHLEHHVLVFHEQTFTPAAAGRVQPPLRPAADPRAASVPAGRPPGSAGDLQHPRERPADRPGRRRPLRHSDLSYKAVPSLGSMLHAQELPLEGGDTLFANQHAAYEALPSKLKREIASLRAEHSYLARYDELRERHPWRPALTQAQIDEVIPAVHPVVRTRPETGRRALFAFRQSGSGLTFGHELKCTDAPFRQSGSGLTFGHELKCMDALRVMLSAELQPVEVPVP